LDEFAVVYAKTYRSLLGYALRRCHSPDDAADVVAETFTIAWRRASDLPPGDEAASGALNAGGPGPAREYANAAVDIQRTDGTYRVHIKDVYADQPG
jgi:Sigma-70 region 2